MSGPDQVFVEVLDLPKINPAHPVPIAIPLDDGSIYQVWIPRMTKDTFAFFLQQLENYRPAIVQMDRLKTGAGDEWGSY